MMMMMMIVEIRYFSKKTNHRNFSSAASFREVHMEVEMRLHIVYLNTEE
jgi:hypothetical protein